MRLGQQIAGAVLLCAATGVGIYRIAEAKNETAVGGSVFRLETRRAAETAAFLNLRSFLSQIGEAPLGDRLEGMREQGAIWVAPSLDARHWAVCVRSLGLVRRVYIRRVALVDPVAHLAAAAAVDAPRPYLQAFAELSLAGALRHELAHYDGADDEGTAYGIEIGWYEGLRSSAWFAGLSEAERRMWDWAIDGALRSAESARTRAGA